MDKFIAARDHWSLYWTNYAIAIGIAALAGLALAYSEYRLERSVEASNWPTTSAFISDSRITETHKTDEYGSKSYVSVFVTLEYEVAKAKKTTVYQNRFRVFDLTDYSKVLAKGTEIQIHFNPEDPTEVSLAPIVPYH